MKKQRPANNSKSQAEHDMIRRLYIAGGTSRQIAQITGFAKNTINRHIMQFRDYIKCQDHGILIYVCKDCRILTAKRRRTLEHIKRDAGITDGA